MQTPDLPTLRAHTLDRGVNPVLYRAARLALVPFFRLYFRLEGVGAEHVPARGAAIVAANHRSFLDPFVIGALARRPVYYMAKRELFEHPLQARLLCALGAFPVDRGAGDEQAMLTALALLEGGECVLIFPEGTRMRRGPLGNPRRGIGRMALQSGAPVVPVAVTGTDRVRRGWRVRPCKVAVRCGRPLRYPLVERPSPRIALGVAERIWACVSLQGQWLGGEMAPAGLAAAERTERHGLRRRGVDKQRSAGRLGSERRGLRRWGVDKRGAEGREAGQSEAGQSEAGQSEAGQSEAGRRAA